MPDRPDSTPGAASQLALTDLERERLDWQRRLYAAEDLAARLLREKNQVEQTLQAQIASLETEVKTLRQRLEEASAVRPDVRRPRTADSQHSDAVAGHDDPFSHVIRQARKGKHARVRRQVRQHALFILLVGVALALAAMLVWQGYRSRVLWQSNVAPTAD